MKKTALLTLIYLACATVQKPDVILKSFNKFAEDSVMQIMRECVTKLPDGLRRVEQSSGNAFLIQDGVLVSSSHLFTTIRGENCQILVKVRGKNIKAEVIVLNTATDVAILKADIHGQALKLREVTDKDQVLYVFGLWPHSTDNDFYSILYFIRATIYGDRTVFGDLRIPLVGMFERGMSGSPVIAPDGQVVGIFSVIGQNSPSLSGGAVKTKFILAALLDYRKYLGK